MSQNEMIDCPTCDGMLPFGCPTCKDTGEVQNPDDEPSGHCCNGFTTGGPSGCMCDLDEPYAENH